jgi:hypothetical protein
MKPGQTLAQKAKELGCTALTLRMWHLEWRGSGYAPDYLIRRHAKNTAPRKWGQRCWTEALRQQIAKGQHRHVGGLALELDRRQRAALVAAACRVREAALAFWRALSQAPLEGVPRIREGQHYRALPPAQGREDRSRYRRNDSDARGGRRRPARSRDACSKGSPSSAARHHRSSPNRPEKNCGAINDKKVKLANQAGVCRSV